MEYRTLSQRIPFRAGGMLCLENYSGSIHLIPWNQEEIEIRVKIEAPNGVTEGDAPGQEAPRIEIENRPEHLNVRTHHNQLSSMDSEAEEGPSFRLPQVHYEIHAPGALNLKIRDHRSDIQVDGFSGQLDIETHKGTVTARDSSGELRIETHKGRAQVARHRGSFNVATRKGTLEMNDMQMERASQIRTHRGTVSLALSGLTSLALSADLGKRAILRGRIGSYKLAQSGGFLESSAKGDEPRLQMSCHSGNVWLECVDFQGPFALR